MAELSYNVRVFMGEELYRKLEEWAFFYDVSLSKAVRIILEGSNLNVPDTIEACPFYGGCELSEESSCDR